jgi:hypothetical protein
MLINTGSPPQPEQPLRTVAGRSPWSADQTADDPAGGECSGRLSSGGYVLNGSIGQPDARSLSAGGYSLQGGFWHDIEPLRYSLFLPLVQKWGWIDIRPSRDRKRENHNLVTLAHISKA